MLYFSERYCTSPPVGCTIICGRTNVGNFKPAHVQRQGLDSTLTLLACIKLYIYVLPVKQSL